MKFPRTRKGWKALFWLTLRRCPIDHSRLCRDWPQYDVGIRYCFKCEGITMWPDGFFDALRKNDRPKEKMT